MYKLIIEDDEGKTTVVPLIRDEITIGRKEGNTIRLTERNVSRRHAKLIRQNGAVYIEDLSSFNGIKVNGDRIPNRATVQEGDRIQIGDYQLALKLDRSQQAGAPAQPEPNDKTTPFIKDNGHGHPMSAPSSSGSQNTPTSMIELVPTTPHHAAGDGPARLVVVSSNFAGQEFVLDKAAVVIGRTDENDIVINHRSISRHHAKIVREGAHYHIVDLQSANGVRVNGEEYNKVELRKGDHVDLGHVRLRFVGAGEDFVFERDAQIVDVPGQQKGKGTLIAVALAALVVVGGGVFVVMKMGKGSGDNGNGKSGDAESQVAKLLLDADKAMMTEDWDTAVAKADEALKLDSSQDLAKNKKKKAEAEKKFKGAFVGFNNAADKGDFDSAIASYGEIAEDSLYRQKGAEKYGQVKRAFVKNHIESAKRARSANKCEEARQHVEAVLTLDEGNSEAQEIVKSCGAVVKINPPSQPKQPKEPKEPKVTPVVSDTPPAGDPAAAEKTFNEAQDAYVHGQYESARSKALTITKAAPKAWRIVGASSCFLKDRDGAIKAYNKLDGQGKGFLKYVCQRNGITVP